MNRPQRNNNPLNLEYHGQLGAMLEDPPLDGSKPRFAKFDTAIRGWQAAVDQIKVDQARGKTFGQFIRGFAPPNENDTLKYIVEVGAKLTVREDTPLKNISAYALAGVMALQEGWFAKAT